MLKKPFPLSLQLAICMLLRVQSCTLLAAELVISIQVSAALCQNTPTVLLQLQIISWSMLAHWARSVGPTCEQAWVEWIHTEPCGCLTHTQTRQGCRDGTAPHRWKSKPTKWWCNDYITDHHKTLTLLVLMRVSLHALVSHTHGSLREMRYPFQWNWDLKFSANITHS